MPKSHFWSSVVKLAVTREVAVILAVAGDFAVIRLWESHERSCYHTAAGEVAVIWLWERLWESLRERLLSYSCGRDCRHTERPGSLLLYYPTDYQCYLPWVQLRKKSLEEHIQRHHHYHNRRDHDRDCMGICPYTMEASCYSTNTIINIHTKFRQIHESLEPQVEARSRVR